jgi:hypothetical protein
MERDSILGVSRHRHLAEMRALYEEIVALWGEGLAKSAWLAIPARPRRGRPVGRHRNLEADALLLNMYRRRVAETGPRRDLAHVVAREAKSRIPNWFPSTEGSIAARVRLLARRSRV